MMDVMEEGKANRHVAVTSTSYKALSVLNLVYVIVDLFKS